MAELFLLASGGSVSNVRKRWEGSQWKKTWYALL